jgi:acetyl-CoA acetyltransferase family protein
LAFETVEIPYGAYWSTPFSKWQGSLQSLHAMKFVAHVAKAWLAERNIDPTSFDTGVLGMTNNQYQSFYGAPWPLYELGAVHTPGHMLTQVCATGPRVLFAGAAEIATGVSQMALLLSADRCSNGAHIYYPAPRNPGNTGQSEDQVLYNMMNDAIAGHSMLKTAENVARKYQISTEEQHAVVLRRYEQYLEALKDDQAFQRRYMILPLSVPKPNFKGEDLVLTGDEGVFATSAEKLAKLKPVLHDGTVTYGGQTHPADGNAGMIVTTPERARDLSKDPSIRVRIKGFGQGRVDIEYMPEAPIVATRKALEHAGVKITDIAAIKSHNPFAVNDIAFARATGVDVMGFNNYGCSLIWGHPQGPTGTRAIIELIEELALRGGGLGLFQGCAAGDSSMAVVIEVSGR